MIRINTDLIDPISVSDDSRFQRPASPTFNATSEPTRDSAFSENNIFDEYRNKAVKVIDKITSAPGALGDALDNLNDFAIQELGKLKKDASLSIEENLKQNKGQAIGRDIGGWLASGNNLYYTLGALIVILLIWKR